MCSEQNEIPNEIFMPNLKKSGSSTALFTSLLTFCRRGDFKNRGRITVEVIGHSWCSQSSWAEVLPACGCGRHGGTNIHAGWPIIATGKTNTCLFCLARKILLLLQAIHPICHFSILWKQFNVFTFSTPYWEFHIYLLQSQSWKVATKKRLFFCPAALILREGKAMYTRPIFIDVDFVL